MHSCMTPGKDTSWLDLPDETKAPATAEPDWLSLPAESVASTGVVAPTHVMPYDALRFECMRGSDRVWACDGHYVVCRPEGFHDATRRRHNMFLRGGHYKHVGTFDDVQVFELTPESPWYRSAQDFRALSFYELMRDAAVAACKRDWVAYTDSLGEIATRCKSTPTGTESGVTEPKLAAERWEDTLGYLFQLIEMRRGPTRAEVDAGMINVRMRRGENRGRVIALPSRPQVVH